MIDATPSQRAFHAEALAFAAAEVAPLADEIDRSERFPWDLARRLGAQGYLGALLPREQGGLGLDLVSYGLLHEALGRHCASTRGLVNVHTMVAHGVRTFGTATQCARLLRPLAAGQLLGAFALTEPEAGSDASGIATTARPYDDGWILDGTKQWISFGQIADVLLVVARTPEGAGAFLVPAGAAGVTREPIGDLLGQRGSLLARIRLSGCRLPADALLGPRAGGLSQVAPAVLDLGRYSVAWGSVGLAQACLDASLQHAAARRQFGRSIGDLQLVQRMIARMVADVGAARALCHRAGLLRDAGDPRAVIETIVAKYFATRMLAGIAGDAVQIHGALGCSAERTVGRHFRDAKVAEIIEGSTQVLEVLIAKHSVRAAPAAGAA